MDSAQAQTRVLSYIAHWEFRLKPNFYLLVFLFSLSRLLNAAQETHTDLAAFAGTYQVSAEQVLKIEVTETGLRGHLPNRPAFILKEADPDRFRVETVNVELLFLRNAQGIIYAVEIRQPLTDIVANRQEGPDAETTPVLPAELLERYAGRYSIGGIYFIRILIEEGTLIYFPPGRTSYPLIPKGNHRFGLKGKDTELEFFLPEEGKAQRFTLKEDGTTRYVFRSDL